MSDTIATKLKVVVAQYGQDIFFCIGSDLEAIQSCKQDA